MNRIPLLAIAAVCCGAQTLEQPVRSVTDPGVITTRQAITPAGVPSIFQGRVYGVAWAGDSGDLWVLHASQVYRLDWKNNRVVANIAHGGTPGNQAIATDPASGDVLIGQSTHDEKSRQTLAGVSIAHGNSLKPLAQGLGQNQPGALAIASQSRADGRRYAAVPLVWENKVAIVNIADGAVVRKIDVGIAPFAAAIDRAGAVAWVSNLGGRTPAADEPFASPAEKPAEHVVVDKRGVAASGTVTRVDVESGATRTIEVGLHPTAVALDESHGRLYVANGNGDSISVIDTQRVSVARTIPLQPFSQTVRGIAPTALQLSADGATLYAACGGINAVAVIDTGAAKIRGMIPAGWYPNGLALDPSGRYLAIASLLGPGSAWRDAPSKRYVHANRGSVAVVPIPNASQLASYTAAVAENTRLRLAGAAPQEERAAARNAIPVPVPARSGEPSTIEHVVFIVKENRTYDQVLGDIAKGNSDPSLVMFGEDVTPNQHRMAEHFVLLDNFFATGGNSADGHQWITQANETEYCLWPGYQGRSYPFDGSDPMAYSSGGFLWNYAEASGRSARVYGEYSGGTTAGASRIDLLHKWESGADFTSKWSARAPIAPLNNILAANYPAYTTGIPDVARAQIFLADLKRFEAEGKFPNLVLLQLPSNHTNGTTPGQSTPKAMVADNDYALGQIVEGLSHSRFWPKMAIFVVEDDAQNGVDHVDGHRTAAFVVSPYVRRGNIDSTFYSHQSMLKTIELILGLPTMSIFDLIALDMRNSFQDDADLATFTAVRPQQDLFELNPPAKQLNGPARAAALDSERMKWSVPDAAPTERLNRILWGAIKGWNTPYPGARQSVFSPLAIDVDDAERERKR